MNVLYLTLSDIKTAYENGIYMDLLNEFIRNGDVVTVVSPSEKKYRKDSYTITKPGMTIIKARTGNLFNVGMIEKGLSQVLLARQYRKALQEFAGNTHFDLILYSTPPITLANIIQGVKEKNNAKTYLLLKDIFPQNALDIGLFKKKGILGIVYKCFRRQEKKLYKLSDRIGCMSLENVRYVLEHNPEIEDNRVEECPNSIRPVDMSVDCETRRKMREKYGLPQEKHIFVYGGNLGKPQDIPFIIECLKSISELKEAHFLIVGDGTEYGKLEKYYEEAGQENFTLLAKLPKEDYDRLVSACDVGLIFLDYRFTIPNFPSRLLSYMQAKLPVLSVTDPHSDVGDIAEQAGFGWKVASNDASMFREKVRQICMADNIAEMGQNAWKYLNEHYDVRQTYDIIKKSVYD